MERQFQDAIRQSPNEARQETKQGPVLERAESRQTANRCARIESLSDGGGV